VKNKISCPITDCDANEDGICITPSAIIIEETGYCQTGLEQMEKKMIVICDQCNGKGTYHKSDMTDDFTPDDCRTWIQNCPRCKGSGRLIEKETEPFVPEKPTR